MKGKKEKKREALNKMLTTTFVPFPLHNNSNNNNDHQHDTAIASIK